MSKESNAARVLGRKGGSSKSEAKVRTARENGKLGGWHKHKPKQSPASADSDSAPTE